MNYTPTELPDVVLLKPRVFEDHRGFFLESWNARNFADLGIHQEFVQDNHGHSIAGTLRGIHYQIQQPQSKLVRVTRGEVYDVAVDLRRSSPTFGHWTGVVLSEQNHHQLWIPVGFGHGYFVLSAIADLVYKCTDYYCPKGERTLVWNDPDIGVDWPLSDGQTPLLSEKDKHGVPFKEVDLFP